MEQEIEQETKPPVEGSSHAHGTPAPEKDAPRPTEGQGISHAHGTPAPEK